MWCLLVIGCKHISILYMCLKLKCSGEPLTIYVFFCINSHMIPALTFVHEYKMTQPVLQEIKHVKVTNYWWYKNKPFFFLKSVLQIMTALKSSSERHPSSLQSSPSHCTAPTKALLSTETLRSSPQGQCSDAGGVAPHSSSLPVSPCSPSAASHTDVSAA